MKRPLTPAALACLAFAACGAEGTSGLTAAELTLIRSTTSFGFCLGYCRSELEITAERATYRLFDDRTGLATLERTAPISPGEWQALGSAVDRDAIEGLAGVIGCPDCADGGAEALEVVAPTWSRKVTFEYLAPLPQLQPLLEQVRAIRNRLDRELRPAGRSVSDQPGAAALHP